MTRVMFLDRMGDTITPDADLLRRDFIAAAPNTTYLGDITYLPYDGEHLQFGDRAAVLTTVTGRPPIAERMCTDSSATPARAAARARQPHRRGLSS